MGALAFAVFLGLVVFQLSSSAPPAGALSTSYYDESCPHLECLVRDAVRRAMENDKTVPAALLRMHFHDCFIRVIDIRRPCHSFDRNQRILPCAVDINRPKFTGKKNDMLVCVRACI